MTRYLVILLTLAVKTTAIEGACGSNVAFVSVNETAPAGTYIISAECLGFSSYSLRGEDVEWFQINRTTGVITTKRSLDAEIIGTPPFLQVDVVPSGCQGQLCSTFLKLFVHVYDINDNVPQFTHLPYRVNVSETTKVKAVVFSVSAYDIDTGVGPPGAQGNKEVTFDIVGGNSNGTFSIGSLSSAGDIILEKPLDFESSNKIFHLNVTATDRYGTGLQNWTIVTITVTNADDNELTFLQSVYEVLVTANPLKKGLEVAKVQAEDKDLNAFSYEFYPASNPDDKFTINNLTGSISVNKNLTRGTYYLIAVAKPLTVSQRTFPAISLVVVHVGSKPNQTFTASVAENAANISVLNLKVVEKYFNVSNTVFTILSGSDGNKFVIDQTSKELRVGAQGLDREENTQVTLVVEVQSSGINRGFAMILVEILDVNDNNPQFQSSTSVAVREDALVGSQIYTVIATDIDTAENGKVVYEIVGGNEEGVFSLNNQTGVLSPSSSLDYETTTQYVLNMSASDLGNPTRRTFIGVTVNVMDVNDNSPVLNPRTVQVSLSEGTVPGTSVAQLKATDADSDANGNITYHIAEDGANKFTIDNVTGVITTTAAFDRESGTNEYTLVVKVQDNGPHPRADIGIVTVRIDNTNEHPPVISPSSYIAGVYKESTYYSIVTTIKASDEDFDPNSVISHFVVGGDGVDMFHVEPDSGHVRVACSMIDKEGSKFTLQVSASDGEKTSTNPATVDIFLLRDEDAVILTTGIQPMEITKKRQEFIGMLEFLTTGKAFIKHLVPQDETNMTSVTFHVVKNETVITGSEIASYLSAKKEIFVAIYEKWKIQTYQAYQSPIRVVPQAWKAEDDGALSAVVGAMICLGVLIGIGAVILLFTLIRRKQAGKSPFKKKKRVRFNDQPLYIFPNLNTIVRDQVESAQEAQEVIVHLPGEDNSSLEGSEDSDEIFMNFGIAAQMAARREKDSIDLQDEKDQEYCFPPPPSGPPPAPPDSDSENESNASESVSDQNNVIADASEVFRQGEYFPETYRSDEEGYSDGIVVNGSPSGSTMGILNNPYIMAAPRIPSTGGSFLRQFSSNETKTDL